MGSLVTRVKMSRPGCHVLSQDIDGAIAREASAGRIAGVVDRAIGNVADVKLILSAVQKESKAVPRLQHTLPRVVLHGISSRRGEAGHIGDVVDLVVVPRVCCR